MQLQKCEKLFCGVLLLFVAGWAWRSREVCRILNFGKNHYCDFRVVPAGAQVPSKADVVDCN